MMLRVIGYINDKNKMGGSVSRISCNILVSDVSQVRLPVHLPKDVRVLDVIWQRVDQGIVLVIW